MYILKILFKVTFIYFSSSSEPFQVTQMGYYRAKIKSKLAKLKENKNTSLHKCS